MYCRVCGDERRTRYYASKRQTLCPACASETPRKVGRVAFERAYWNGAGDVPDAIKREFYEDYLRSRHTLADYITTTTSYGG